MQARDLVDVAIEEDPRASCLWAPSELWPEFCAAIDQRPNRVGAVTYPEQDRPRGAPLTDIAARRP